MTWSQQPSEPQPPLGQPPSAQPPFAQPSYPPQSFGSAPLAPPRRGVATRTVLIIVGIVAVLCCGGIAGGGFLLYHGLRAATGPARDAADTFVTDLEGGDVDGAYRLLCTATRRQYPLSAFRSGVETQPKISSHTINGVFVNTTNGVSSATVNARLILDTGLVDQHVFSLVEEAGDWRVCGQPY
jgi:hypothetical protein